MRHIQCVYVLRWKSIRKKIANGLTTTDGFMQIRIQIQITVDVVEVVEVVVCTAFQKIQITVDVVEVVEVVVCTAFQTRKLHGMMWTWCP